ncbi:MAG TPA: hypothetical protein VFZ28_10805 [Burkholderiaceae bacterium]|nr:hypothetical protein [Burkholderiaceae bacterium]
MASSSTSRKGSRQMPLKDRRAPAGKGGPLRKLKGLLGRPLGIERREGKLQLVLAERRRPRPADEPPSLSQLCAELSARLLAHEHGEVQTMRHLILVHDALDRRGWIALESMSALVLAKAIEQAEALAAEEPSPHMDMLLEGLRPLHVAADLRDLRDSRMQDFRVGDNLQVSESDFAEFEDCETNWSGTVPIGLVPPHERDE